MSIKVNAFGFDSSLGRLCQTKNVLNVVDVEDCVAKTYIENTVIMFDGLNNNRPYFKMTGYIKALTGDFPAGISEVTFDEGLNISECPNFSMSFELTDEEIARFALKGLFKKGFDIPHEYLVENSNGLELPIKSCSVMALSDKSLTAETPPVVFVKINNGLELVTNSYESGYDLVDYFEDYEKDLEKVDTIKYKKSLDVVKSLDVESSIQSQIGDELASDLLKKQSLEEVEEEVEDTNNKAIDLFKELLEEDSNRKRPLNIVTVKSDSVSNIKISTTDVLPAEVLTNVESKDSDAYQF